MRAIRAYEPVDRSVLVDVKSVSVQFGKTVILEQVSLQVHQGSTTVILGDSGCGKTTLLKLIANQTKPTAGEIRHFCDLQAGGSRGAVIYLDQDPLLFEHLNVFENIAFGLRIRKRPQIEIENKVNAILHAIQLTDHAKKRSWELSGGQKQRVAFARAIVIEPSLILLDEPFSSLDGRTRLAMQTLFNELKNLYSITAVFVTHDLKEALEVGQCFAWMSGGKLQSYKDRDAFMNDPCTGVISEKSFWTKVQ